MKAMAASRIVIYEQAVRALTEYDRAVTLGLAAVLRRIEWRQVGAKAAPPAGAVNAIVFGSDQGLVGQFNDVIADFAIDALAKRTGTPAVWVVGERVHARLLDAGLAVQGIFAVPNDLGGVTQLVGQLQAEIKTDELHDEAVPLYVFHNRQRSGAAYEPVSQRFLPLDREWRDSTSACRWPTKLMPDLLPDPSIMLRALVSEYLFISLYQACTESLASENASRLAAMQRAEKNIAELTEELTGRFHRVRQTRIDEELFDVVSGFEALGWMLAHKIL